MMWTKGNKNGEWEADGMNGLVGGIAFAVSFKGGDGEDIIKSIQLKNSYDARLIELAPRMAEALLTWYNAPYGDEASKEFSVLCKELHKMKHGDK